MAKKFIFLAFGLLCVIIQANNPDHQQRPGSFKQTGISRTESHFKTQHGINEQHRKNNSENRDTYRDWKNRFKVHNAELQRDHPAYIIVTTQEIVTNKMPVVDVDISMQNNAKRNEYTDGKHLEKQKPGVTQLGNKSRTVQWLDEDIETKKDNKTKYKESNDEKNKMFTQKMTPVNLQIYSGKPVKSNDGTVHAVAFAGKDSKSDKLPEKVNMHRNLDETKYSSFVLTPKQNKTNKLFHVNEDSSRTPVGEDDSDVQIKPFGQEIISKNKSIQLQGDIHEPDYLIGEKTVGLIIDDRNGFKLMDGDHQSADPNGTDVHILGNLDTNPINSIAKEVKVNKSQNETNKDGRNHFSTKHVSAVKVDLSQAKVHEHINGKLLFKVASNDSLSNKGDKNDETGKLLDKGNDKIFTTDDPLTLRTVPVNLDGKDLQVNGTSKQTGKMEPDARFQPGKESVAKSGGKQDLTGKNHDHTNGQSGNIPKRSIVLVNEKTIVNIQKSPVSILIAVVVLAVAVVIIASVIKRKCCSRSKNSGYHQLPWDVDIEDIEMHPQYKIA